MGSKILTYKNAIVKIGTKTRNDLFVKEWSIRPAPFWEQAKVVSKSLSDLPKVGDSVKIESPEEIGSRSFAGKIISIERKISNKEIHAELIVQHEVKSSLSNTILGITEKFKSGYFHNESEITKFDIDQYRQSKNKVTINSKSTHVFSQEKDCKPWKIANAIHYILTTELDADSIRPSLDDLDNIFGNKVLIDCNITGLSAEDALIKIARKGDAELWNSNNESSICFIKKGSPITNININLQAKGEILDTTKSNVNSLSIITKPKQQQKGLLVTGNHIRIEATWELKPGWVGNPVSTHPQGFQRRNNHTNPKNNLYYRKWVLNEAGQYSGIDTYDFTTLDNRFKRKIKRCFLPPVIRSKNTTPFPGIVEYKIGDENWKIYEGSVLACTTECSIHLADERLPLNYIEQAIAKNVKLRVTASVLSDVRISEKKAIPNSGQYTRKDLGNKYCSNAYLSSSYYNTHGDAYKPEQSPLFLLSNAYEAKVRPNIFGTCKLAWIDTSVNPINKIKVNVANSGILEKDKIGIKEIVHDFLDYSTTVKIEGITNAN